MRIMNIALATLITGIAFLVGGAAFNVGFCKGLQSTIVAGTLKAPLDTASPVLWLDSESQTLQVKNYTATWSIPLQSNVNDYLQQTGRVQEQF